MDRHQFRDFQNNCPQGYPRVKSNIGFEPTPWISSTKVPGLKMLHKEGFRITSSRNSSNKVADLKMLPQEWFQTLAI